MVPDIATPRADLIGRPDQTSWAPHEPRGNRVNICEGFGFEKDFQNATSEIRLAGRGALRRNLESDIIGFAVFGIIGLALPMVFVRRKLDEHCDADQRPASFAGQVAGEQGLQTASVPGIAFLQFLHMLRAAPDSYLAGRTGPGAG
jgi:hypothetical protein